MIDTPFLYGTIAIMLIVIITDYLKRKYNIDLNNFDYVHYKQWFLDGIKNGFKPIDPNIKPNVKVIERTTGDKTLVLLDAGTNKATVMATLRQITGLDYKEAKNVVESVPSTFMTNISDKEADLTKKALEFVGAKVEIR